MTARKRPYRPRFRYQLTAKGIVALALDEAKRQPPTNGFGRPREGWTITPEGAAVLQREQFRD